MRRSKQPTEAWRLAVVHPDDPLPIPSTINMGPRDTLVVWAYGKKVYEHGPPGRFVRIELVHFEVVPL